MDICDRAQGAKWRWPLLVSILIVNVFLPSLVLSYGVLWMHYSTLEVPLWFGLATPSVFFVTYGLTQCWFREAADSWGGTIGYRAMASAGLVLVVVSLLACAFISLYLQPFMFGIMGGVGYSLISAQVDAIIFETFDSRLRIIRGLGFTGQAIGLSLFPHILSVLIDCYGDMFTFIVLSGIMLQTLPAILLLKVEIKKSHISRYKDLSQTIMILKNEGIEDLYATELHNLEKKCWKSPSDDNLHLDDENDYDNSNVTETITPPPSPEEKRRNIFGVEILPEIPEESEESDTDEVNEIETSFNNKKRLSVAIKRLSTLGSNLDGCIINQVRRDSQSDNDNNTKDYSEVEVTYEMVAPITDVQTEKLFNSFRFRCQSVCTNMKRKLFIPSYKMYRIRRRLLYLVYYINDTFVKPLKRSLSCRQFYPSLLLSFAKLSLTTVSLIILPMLALQIHPRISSLETNFLISLYGFTWICFLLCTPWLVQTSKRNFKYIIVSGLLVSTCACFVLAKTNNHDTFSIGCVIAGFGFGAINSCWETTVQDYIGARKWPKLHSTLETLSAILLGLFTLSLTFVIENENGMQMSMFILGIVLAVISFVWLVISGVSLYRDSTRSWRTKSSWISYRTQMSS